LYIYVSNLSLFNLTLSVYFRHLMFWLGQTVSLHCQFGFLFLPLSLCLLLCLLSSFILALVILALQFLFNELFLLSQVSTHLEHLLI
jgi:hypothetical protein